MRSNGARRGAGQPAGGGSCSPEMRELLLLAGQEELGARAREAADVVARQEEKEAAAIGRR